MSRFLKIPRRTLDELNKHFRTRIVTECIECSTEFSARNRVTLIADLHMAGWRYFKDKNHDIEGPMCPSCQLIYMEDKG